MEPADVVRALFEAMQERDWDAAAARLARDVRIGYPHTGETFAGDSFLAMNRDYPQGWSLVVHEVLAAGDRVAARVAVTHDGDVFWCTGFYSVAGDVVTEGVEHWLTEGAEAPPAWREPYRVPLPAAGGPVTRDG